MSRARDSVSKPTLSLFLLLWLALPVFSRVWMLWGWEGSWFEVGLGFGLGLVQDLAVIAQAGFLMWLAFKGFGRRPIWLFLGWLFFLVHALYVTVDLLLYGAIDIRMTVAFFHFLFDIETFADSFEEVNALGFAAISLVALVGSGWAFTRIRAPGEALFGALRGRRLAASLTIFASLQGGAALGYLYGPGEALYLSSNALFAGEMQGARELLGVEDVLLELAKEEDGETRWVPTFEEDYRLLNEDAPLCRETKAFHGDPLFKLDLEPGEQPHVLLLVMESFRGVDVGVMGGEYPVTPRFDALSKEGIFFDQFYATGVQTTRAMVSLLAGVQPRFSEAALQATDPDFPLRGLPHLFAEAGYHTAYIHNGELDFESMDAFVAHQGFSEIVGHEEIRAWRPGAPEFSWGVHDEVLMDYLIERIETQVQKKEPTFITAFTISNHHPWELPESWDPIDLPISSEETYGKFLRAMHYSDDALGRLIDGLRARDLTKDLLIFITADTSQAMGERKDNFALSRALYEEHVRVPALLLADGRIPPQVSHQISSQIDLLPTLLDLLHLKGPHHSTGTSMARDLPHSAYFASPFALGYWGLRQEEWTYFYVMRADKDHLYQIKEDPSQSHNLADQHPDLVHAFRLELARIHRLHHEHYDRGDFCF